MLSALCYGGDVAPPAALFWSSPAGCAVRNLEPLGGFSFLDSAQRISVTHRPTGSRLRVLVVERKNGNGNLNTRTPAARGDRLIDALIVWITTDRPLEPGINRFEVRVSEPGDTWIERLRW